MMRHVPAYLINSEQEIDPLWSKRDLDNWDDSRRINA